MSWKEKFRWIKQILIHGNLWSDNIVLSDQKVSELVKYIEKNIKFMLTSNRISFTMLDIES